MISFLTNPWTISIITGIIVFILTDFIKGYRRKKDYYQNAELANLEMLQTLKTLIPEQELPDISIIKSMHSSTARKYEINLEDMNSLDLILDDLIKEIMDTSFLAYKDKVVYSHGVKKLKDGHQEREREKTEFASIESIRDLSGKHLMYHEKRVTSLIITTLMSTIVAVIVYVISNVKNDINFTLFDIINRENPVPLLIVIILTLVLGIVFSNRIMKRSYIFEAKRRKAIERKDREES